MTISLNTNASSTSTSFVHGEASRLSVMDVQGQIDALIEQIMAIADQMEGMMAANAAARAKAKEDAEALRAAMRKWQQAAQAKLTDLTNRMAAANITAQEAQRELGELQNSIHDLEGMVDSSTLERLERQLWTQAKEILAALEPRDAYVRVGSNAAAFTGTPAANGLPAKGVTELDTEAEINTANANTWINGWKDGAPPWHLARVFLCTPDTNISGRHGGYIANGSGGQFKIGSPEEWGWDPNHFRAGVGIGTFETLAAELGPDVDLDAWIETNGLHIEGDDRVVWKPSQMEMSFYRFWFNSTEGQASLESLSRGGANFDIHNPTHFPVAGANGILAGEAPDVGDRIGGTIADTIGDIIDGRAEADDDPPSAEVPQADEVPQAPSSDPVVWTPSDRDWVDPEGSVPGAIIDLVAALDVPGLDVELLGATANQALQDGNHFELLVNGVQNAYRWDEEARTLTQVSNLERNLGDAATVIGLDDGQLFVPYVLPEPTNPWIDDRTGTIPGPVLGAVNHLSDELGVDVVLLGASKSFPTGTFELRVNGVQNAYEWNELTQTFTQRSNSDRNLGNQPTVLGPEQDQVSLPWVMPEPNNPWVDDRAGTMPDPVIDAANHLSQELGYDVVLLGRSANPNLPDGDHFELRVNGYQSAYAWDAASQTFTQITQIDRNLGGETTVLGPDHANIPVVLPEPNNEWVLNVADSIPKVVIDAVDVMRGRGIDVVLLGATSNEALDSRHHYELRVNGEQNAYRWDNDTRTFTQVSNTEQRVIVLSYDDNADWPFTVPEPTNRWVNPDSTRVPVEVFEAVEKFAKSGIPVELLGASIRVPFTDPTHYELRVDGQQGTYEWDARREEFVQVNDRHWRRQVVSDEYDKLHPTVV